MKRLVAIGLAAVTFGVLLTISPWRSTEALAQRSNCETLLQFDTTSLQTNVAMQLSILNTVNSSNYEQSKTNMGASLPGYFSGTFDQFSEKRNQLQSSFSQTELRTFSQNLYQRIVSPESAKAYETCKRSDQPFVAWVSSTGVTNNRVAVTVKNNLRGNGSISYTVHGATPINTPTTLTAGSEETLWFNSPKSQDFFLVINARDAQSGASYSVPPIELPAYVEYRRTPVYQNVTGTGRCGAGCQGNTSGCQEHRNVTLAAPAGFTLDPDSLHLSNRRVVGGPGVNTDPPWSWTRTPSGSSPITMLGSPGICDGMSAHTQGIVDYDFTIRAVRYRVERVQ